MGLFDVSGFDWSTPLDYTAPTSMDLGSSGWLDSSLYDWSTPLDYSAPSFDFSTYTPPTPTDPWAGSASSFPDFSNYTPGTNAPTSDQLINQFMGQAGGNPTQALIAAEAQRTMDPNLTLRDAAHSLFSASLLQDHPVLGAMALPFLVPAYSGAKAAVQALPTPVGNAIDKLSPIELAHASPPSWSEIAAGLQPLLGRIGLSTNPFSRTKPGL